MKTFRTKDNLESSPSEPLCKGIFIDFDDFVDPDDKQSALKRALRLRRDDICRGPYIVMDVAKPSDMNIEIDGEDYKGDSDSLAKLVISCNHIIDLTKIGSKMGNSVVKCNPSVPTYRWFQAGNLMLNQCNQKGRIIPFPIDQESDDGVKQTTYHVLQVTIDEYKRYAEVLQYGINVQGLERGFDAAARFSYQILLERGVKEITADAVDRIVTHVMLTKGGMEGVLLLNAEEEDFEDLQSSADVFY